MGKDGDVTDERREARRAGRGRPTKNQEILARMAVVIDPEASGRMLFADGFTAEDLIEARGIEAKLDAISRKIAARLETARKEAKIRHDSEGGQDGVLASLRQWADQDFPENVVHLCEQQYYANDRVISALLAHLVEHIVIGEELRSIARTARRRSAEELKHLPVGMIEFANRLMAAGVVNGDVRKMSRERLAAVVATIQGVELGCVEEDVSAIPMGMLPLPDNSVSSEEEWNGFIGKADDGLVPDPEAVVLEVGSSDEVTGNELAEIGASDSDCNLSLVALEPDSELSILSAEPSPPYQPKGRWDDLDLTPLGYRIEEAVASTDADFAALKMRLPEVSSLRELALPRSGEMMLMDGIDQQRDRVFLEKWCYRYGERTSIVLTPDEQRAWALLLVDLPSGGMGRQMGCDYWYDGLVIPGPEGTARVRRIITIRDGEAA